MPFAKLAYQKKRKEHLMKTGQDLGPYEEHIKKNKKSNLKVNKK